MKHNNYAEHELRLRIKAEGANWVARQQFWLFGTAKYVDGTEIHESQAHKDIRHYFNTVDKAILRRQDYDEGRRQKAEGYKGWYLLSTAEIVLTRIFTFFSKAHT